ncbi:MAG: YfiR family protein [Acidobacteriota bacterium]
MRGHTVVHVVIAAGLLGWVSAAAAQTPSLTEIKAAFLFNFANYAEWPADSLTPGQRLLLCVVDDRAIADALTHAIKARTVGGHEVQVEVVPADGKIRTCHLLYAGPLDLKRFTQVMEMVKGAAVFTVGDDDQFAASGGIAQFIVEHDRMRFAINPAAATRARIRLSSKLLNLAKIVKE